MEPASTDPRPPQPEHRSHRQLSYSADFDCMNRPTQTRCVVVCPYCGTHVVAYVWSLSGSGKRCPKPCGALHTNGVTFKS